MMNFKSNWHIETVVLLSKGEITEVMEAKNDNKRQPKNGYSNILFGLVF